MYLIDYKNVRLSESILKMKQKSSLTSCFGRKEETRNHIEVPESQTITREYGFQYQIQSQKD